MWDPAFFYPASDTLAYSDLMPSFGPLFWPWGALGCSVVPSFQLWMLCVAGCNLLISHLLLRRGAGIDHVGSAPGSFLVSFAASRTARVGHQQMLPIFFVVGALWAAWPLVASASVPETEARRPRVVVAMAGCLVAQLYGDQLNFTFAVAIVAAAALSALAMTEPRRVLTVLARRNWAAIVAASGVAVMLALPAASHDLEAAGRVGARRPAAAWSRPHARRGSSGERAGASRSGSRSRSSSCWV